MLRTLKKRKKKIKNSPVLHQLHSAGNAHVSASLQRQKRTYGKKGREFHQSRHWGLFGCFTVRSSPGTRPPVPSRRGKHNTNHNAYQQQSQTRALSEQTGNNETLSRMPTWRDSMEVTWWNWKLKDKQRRHGKQQKRRKQVSSSRRAAITSMDGRREWIYTTPQMVILRLMCCNMAPVKLKGDTSLCSLEKGTWLQPWSYIHGVTPDVITLTSEQTWHLSSWHYSQAFVPALKKKRADFFTRMTIHSCAKRLQSRTNHWQGRLNVGGWYQHTPRIGTGTVIYFPQLFFEQFACFETTEIKWHCTPPTWRHLREDGLTWRKKKTFLENATRRVGSCLESKYTQRLACGLLHWTNMEHLICRVHVNKHLSHRATDMLPLTLASGN